MSDLGSQSITILTAPLVELRSGSFKRDWENATETLVLGCSVQPFILAEKLNYTNDAEREFTKNSFRVFAPPGTVVSAEDHILYNGVEYEVQGIPGEWYDFDGSMDHVAFLIRERRG